MVLHKLIPISLHGAGSPPLTGRDGLREEERTHESAVGSGDA